MRSRRSQRLFGLLVLAQAAHSIEEYIFRLWESLPPARLIAGLISSDLERGFAIGNVALFLFGAWCYLWPVRRGWPSARTLMWAWAMVEIANGFVHPLWSLRQGMYTAGTVTAPFLGVLGFLLARELRRPATQDTLAA